MMDRESRPPQPRSFWRYWLERWCIFRHHCLDGLRGNSRHCSPAQSYNRAVTTTCCLFSVILMFTVKHCTKLTFYRFHIKPIGVARLTREKKYPNLFFICSVFGFIFSFRQKSHYSTSSESEFSQKNWRTLIVEELFYMIKHHFITLQRKCSQPEIMQIDCLYLTGATQNN